MTKKLFAVLLGGRAEGAHIELHDLVFTVGDSLEETYPKLVNKWFGKIHKRLHIDGVLELDIVDGFKVTLSSSLPENQLDLLYCVNFGGYQEGYFTEVHDIGFFVSQNKKDVIKRAKEKLCVNAFQQHCDDNFAIGSDNLQKDIDDIIKLHQVDGYYIHLEPTEMISKQKIQSHYVRLDTKEVLDQLNQLNSEAVI